MVYVDAADAINKSEAGDHERELVVQKRLRGGSPAPRSDQEMRFTETIRSGDTDNVVNNLLNDTFTNRLFQQARCFSDNSSQFQPSP